jgi:hypothetical protein
MIEFLGIKISAEALVFLSLFVVSEVLPYTRLRSSSIAQFVIQAAATLKPFRSEDDKVARIKAQIEAIQKELQG